MSMVTQAGDLTHIYRGDMTTNWDRTERRLNIASPKRDLLEVLRLDLEFLKGGGYRRASLGRPQFIFEDSPTCLNFGNLSIRNRAPRAC